MLCRALLQAGDALGEELAAEADSAEVQQSLSLREQYQEALREMGECC